MRVGLTGGIASGKSTVAAMLAELGAVVVDADRLAREVVAKGTPGLQQVVDAFGSDVLTADGGMDRAKVGALVFADEEKRRRLESIIHPLVRARGDELEAQAAPGAVVVHDIPLLVETQVKRMVRDRGWTEEDARARIAAQASREERLAAATYVIGNSGTRGDLRRRVTEVFEALAPRP